MRSIAFAALAALLTAACAQAAVAAEGVDIIAPGEAVTTATVHCIGVYWPMTGDNNGSAFCAVEYRKSGEDRWRDAMPLHRKAPLAVDVEKSMAGNRPITFLGGLSKWDRNTLRYATEHWEANYLAGSIFNLDPDTDYEISLHLIDAEAVTDITKIVTAHTRAVPQVPTKGTVDVPSGDAAALKSALDNAQPGDVIALHKGVYKGPFTITASGQASRPIVVRDAGDGDVVIEGTGYGPEGGTAVTIMGSHVWLHGIEIRNATTGVNIGYGRLDNPERWTQLNADGKSTPSTSPSRAAACASCSMRSSGPATSATSLTTTSPASRATSRASTGARARALR